MQTYKNLTVEYYGESNLGLIRTENQDSFGKFPVDSVELENPKGLLFIIADGMGGHIGGKEASQSAVDIINQEYFANSSNDVSICLRYAFKTANTKIFKSSKGDLQYQKKGTTCSAIVMEKGLAHIAHVGDSRIYKISGDEIKQLTNDHTQVEEMLRKGILSKEEAQNHPAKSVLVRALGIEPDVEIDIIENIPLMPGEKFVLCSDGLAKVNKDEIYKIASANLPSVACKELIQLANERGGHDNVTVQIIKLIDDGKENIYVDKKPKTKSAEKWLKFSVIGLLVVCFILLVANFQENIKNLFRSDTSTVNTNVENSILPEDDKLETLLTKANNNLSSGELDSALVFYDLILADYPMHMGALNGAGQIADEYIKQGNVLINQKNYSEAVIFYRKAIKIRTEDQKLYNLILLCEKEIQKQNNEPLIPGDNLIVETKTENLTGNKKNLSNDESGLYNSDFQDWNFEYLSESDYNFSDNKITFLNTGKPKKVINKKVMEDFDVQVNLRLDSGINNRAGIIVGYSKTESGNESYFLFSTDEKGNFILDKFSGTQEKRLLSIKKPVESKNNPVKYNLKIKCLGPWIMIYNNNKLLDSWLNEDFVLGNIGLFADVSSFAEFSDIKVSSAFDNQDKN